MRSSRQRRRLRRALARVAIAAGVSLVSAVSGTRSAQALDPDPCAESDVNYLVSANLMLRDTPMGAADGVYPQGSGTLRLHVRRDPAGLASEVRLVALDIDDHIVIANRTLAWTTTVTTDARTTVKHDAAGATMRKGVIDWKTNVSGYRTDGTVRCEGVMCGSFGAPPRGATPLHDGPFTVQFKPFVLSADGSTFTMDYSLVSHTPGQSAYLGMSGRQVARTCTSPPRGG